MDIGVKGLCPRIYVSPCVPALIWNVVMVTDANVVPKSFGGPRAEFARAAHARRWTIGGR